MVIKGGGGLNFLENSLIWVGHNEMFLAVEKSKNAIWPPNVNNVQPSNMQISWDLLKSGKASRKRYQIHLEDQRKKSKKKEKSDENNQFRVYHLGVSHFYI